MSSEAKAAVTSAIRSPTRPAGKPAARLMILMGALIALAITLGTALLILSSRTEAIADAKQNLQSLTIVLGDQVSRWFQAVDIMQEAAANRLRMEGITSVEALKERASTKEWHEILAAWTKSSPSVRALSLIDADGNVVNSSRNWPLPAINVADRQYFQIPRNAASAESYVSEPLINRGTGDWTVFVARRLTSGNGDFIGIIATSILLSDLETFYASISHNKHMAIGLLRRDGMLLARFPRVVDALGRIDPSQSSVFSSLKPGAVSVVQQRSFIDGQDRYFAATALERHALVIAISSTVDAALAGWRHQAVQMILIAAAMNLAAFIAALLGRRGIRASERMARTAGKLARRDTLTGLPNRLHFNENMEKLAEDFRRHGRASAILILDLDQFKEVNDTLGHFVGDDLLKIVARRLRARLAKADQIARLGGDEFAIVLTQPNGEDWVDARAQDIIRDICEPYEIGPNQIVIGASIGGAMLPQDGVEPDALLRRADLALYRAKASGRRSFRAFTVEMEAQVCTRRALDIELRKALEADGFELAYQPQLDLRSNRVTGFEALLRWKHKDLGYIPPSEFVPIAEDSGLIGDLGAWVLTTACQRAATWPHSVKVAVNLSAMQLRRRDVVADVMKALESSNLPPERLELEITESVLIDDDSSAGEALHRLKGLGLSIALDDFGTGYASLSYLRRFPFDKLKIDRSFVGDMERSAGSAAIVETTLTLARRLGITTTAEGVETPEQLITLRALGCTHAQGYLISRAVAGDETIQLLGRKSSHLEAVN